MIFRRMAALAAYSTLVCIVSVGCNAGNETTVWRVSTGGDPAHGKQIISSYGCGACHMIPGVQNARGLVGPPLMYFSQRTMIAGELPNTPENLVRWLRNPQSVEPKTAMPNMGLSESQAWDVTAYLYTLRGSEEELWNR